jgi:hypothetical protein
VGGKDKVGQVTNERNIKQKWDFFKDALHIFVLCSFAFAQPLFDILSRNAEFFVLWRSEPTDVILLILILGIVIPTFIVSVEAVAGLFGRRVRKVVHGFVVASLVGIIVLPALEQIVDLPGTVLLVGAVFLGMTAATAYMRFPPVRMFLTVLLPAVLLFPGFFLFNSPVFKVLFAGDNSGANYAEVDTTAPVVVVVLDELPVISLMDEHHQIDPIRYPNFAALARHATWFRNATTVSEVTEYGIPAILTGNYPDPARLPTAADHPQNIFTWLGGSYDLEALGPVTALCPDRLCERVHESLIKRMNSLLSDLSIIYVHVILPKDLSAGLPSVTHKWMDFADGTLKNSVSDKSLLERLRSLSKGDRFQQFMEFVNAINSAEQRTLYFLHSLLPHIPYNYVPSGENVIDMLAPAGVPR